MNNLFLKKSLKHIGAIALITILSVSYFFPEFQGKKIPSHDGISAVAASKESRDFKEKGETILWSTRIFSGMPLFQIAYAVNSNFVRKAEIYRNVFGVNTNMMIALMLGMYICLSLFGIRYEISLIGAIGFGLSTWFLLSIEASHSTKIFTISYIPPLIASIYYAYRKQLLLGGILTSFFLCLAIAANHVQIVYFSIFFITILVVFELIYNLKNKTVTAFIKKSAILIAFGILGVLPNTTLLWTTYDFGEETIRAGKSELTKEGNLPKSSGLDMDYSFRWSYGKAESFNFLIPNYGGAGLTLDEKSATFNELRKSGMPKTQTLNTLKQIYNYYAGADGNTGPTYLGAVLLFLFLLLFFIEKSKIKWMLLSVVILSLVFSWGKNGAILGLNINEFFFNHFPFYNKFRTPSMWLSLAMIAVTFGAMMALKVIVDKDYDTAQLKKALIYTGGILGGILISRDGLKKWFFLMVLSLNIPNAFYAYLAITKTSSLIAVVITVVLEQFGYGFAIVGFMVFLIYIAEGMSKTSHYAIATGFMALGMMLPGLISGYMQEWLGYDGFFVWVVIAAIPSLILLKYIKYPPDYGKKSI